MAIPNENASRRIGPDSAGVLMTPEEFDAAEDWDDLYQYELVHHVLIARPIPDIGVRCGSQMLSHLLLAYGESSPHGLSLDATVHNEYVHTSDSRRLVNNAIWAGLGRMPDLPDDAPTIAADFVLAGMRPLLRSYIHKRDTCFEAGVREYWLVDRFDRTVTVFTRSGTAVACRVIREGHSYQPDLLPEFVLPVGQVLRRMDAWTKT